MWYAWTGVEMYLIVCAQMHASRGCVHARGGYVYACVGVWMKCVYIYEGI